MGVSDEGEESVVVPQQLSKRITRHDLQGLVSSDTYEEIAKQFHSFYRKWTEIAKSAKLPKSLITPLRCAHPAYPVRYVLIKIHKLGGDDPTQH